MFDIYDDFDLQEDFFSEDGMDFDDNLTFESARDAAKVMSIIVSAWFVFFIFCQITDSTSTLSFTAICSCSSDERVYISYVLAAAIVCLISSEKADHR